MAGGFRGLLARLRDLLTEDQVHYVIDVDSPSLLAVQPNAEMLPAGAVGVARRFSASPKLVQSILIVGGPVADGTTANKGTIWVGGAGVGSGNGTPISPGGSISLEAIDLNKLWWNPDVAADRLRILTMV